MRYIAYRIAVVNKQNGCGFITEKAYGGTAGSADCDAADPVIDHRAKANF
jgi:hypothetical protein